MGPRLLTARESCSQYIAPNAIADEAVPIGRRMRSSSAARSTSALR